MSSRYHETLEQVRMGLDAFEIRISFRNVSLVPRARENSGRARAYLGAYQTVQPTLETRRANILSQHGDRIPYGIHLPLMLPQMA